MRGMTKRRQALLVLCAGLVLPLSAQNLLPNPDLNHDAAGWAALNGTAGWILIDADGCHTSGGSGGLRLVPVLDTGVYGARAEGGCVLVVPNQNLCFGMEYILGGEFVQVRATWFIDNNCLVPTGASQIILGAHVASFSSLLGCTAVPASVTSIRISAESSGFEANGSFTLVADRFYAGAQEPVHLDDFEAASFCRWSSSVP